MPKTNIRTINKQLFYFFTDVNQSILQTIWQKLKSVSRGNNEEAVMFLGNGRYLFLFGKRFAPDAPFKVAGKKHFCVTVDFDVNPNNLEDSTGAELIFINHGKGRIEVGQTLHSNVIQMEAEFLSECPTEPEDMPHLTDDELRRILAQMSRCESVQKKTACANGE